MDFLHFKKKTRSLNLNNREVQKVYKKGFSQFPKIIISSNLNNEEGQKPRSSNLKGRAIIYLLLNLDFSNCQKVQTKIREKFIVYKN